MGVNEAESIKTEHDARDELMAREYELTRRDNELLQKVLELMIVQGDLKVRANLLNEERLKSVKLLEKARVFVKRAAAEKKAAEHAQIELKTVEDKLADTESRRAKMKELATMTKDELDVLLAKQGAGKPMTVDAYKALSAYRDDALEKTYDFFHSGSLHTLRMAQLARTNISLQELMRWSLGDPYSDNI